MVINLIIESMDWIEIWIDALYEIVDW